MSKRISRLHGHYYSKCLKVVHLCFCVLIVSRNLFRLTANLLLYFVIVAVTFAFVPVATSPCRAVSKHLVHEN